MQLLPVTSRRGVLAVLAFLAFCLALPDTAAAQTVPTVSVSGGSATEGASVTFTVSLSAVAEQTVTVQYATSSGTATSGTDFTATSGTLTFLPLPGGDILTVSVPTTEDRDAEADETFTLTLSNPTNATLGTNTTATGTINEPDEESLPLVRVSGGNSATEGNDVAFTITLSKASESLVTVNYTPHQARGDTATRDDDFSWLGGVLLVGPGVTSATINVSTTDDALDEENETFTVTLRSATNAALSASKSAGGTILDNDSPPTVSVSNASATEGSAVSFTVSLSTDSGRPVTVAYATASSTATSGTDFTAASGTLTFAEGTDSQTVSVSTTEDTDDEGDETFTLTLSSPTNATLADDTATGTINDDDATASPTVNLSGGSETEGASVDFTVSLSVASAQTVTVDYATASDTATSGTDFTAASGTLTFAAGTDSQTVSVATTNDSTDEENETFTLTLSNPTNATLGDNAATGTIRDNDDPPTVSVADATADEGDDVVFTVSLSPASGKQVTVQYATSSGSATSGTDFTAASGTLTFAAGTTSQTVSVSTASDSTTEQNEFFVLTLSSPTNAILAANDSTATGTINDDGPPAVGVVDATQPEGGSVHFTVLLSTSTTREVTVQYATSSGTATSGTDFTATSGTLTFAAGTDSQTVSVATTNDSTDEENETFTLTLSSPTNATLGANTTATGTITDNDDPPTVSVANASTTEGDAVDFTVSLSTASAKEVTVQYATASGTATSGTDFTAASGTLTFSAGMDSQPVRVSTTGDATDEGNETFTLTLSNPTNAALGANTTATGTINDDDGTSTVSVANASATEGSAVTFTVSLLPASGQQVTVQYATSGGTATSGTDFTAASGTLTFAPNETSKTVSVPTTEDTDTEADETFTLTLSSPTNATLGDDTATGTINDNDSTALPTVNVSGGSATEGASVTFTVSLLGATEETVTVQYATASGTATSGTDFTAKSGTLTFLPLPGGDILTVSVPTTEDTDAEADETFTLTLSNPTNATLGANATATGTINEPDEESPPLVSVSGGNSATEGNAVAFTITLSKASESLVTVNYTPHQARGDTATRDDDFSWLSGVLLLGPGATSGTIQVTTTDDPLEEEDETFTVTLTGATHAVLGASTSARGTILDNDSPPTVSVSNASATEGSSVSFTVSLSAESGKPVTVDYATASGTATSGTDFTAASGTLTFTAGTDSQTVSVSTTDDSTDEGNETFTLTLSGPTNATLADDTATGTINDNDSAAPPTVNVSGGSADEGNAVTFAITLSVASAQTVTVDYATASGTATSGTDFTAVSGTLTFAAGTDSQTVSVATTNDSTDEENETFTLTLSSPTNATLGDDTATGTIRDNDDPPLIRVSDASAPEGGTVDFMLSLSAESGKQVTVQYETAGGSAQGRTLARAQRAAASETAESGTDFTPESGTVIFSPGTTSQTVSVQTVDDAEDEENEIITLTLSSATNAALAPGNTTATGTIADDDGASTLSVSDVSATEGGSVNFRVSLLPASGQPVTVRYATASGTAESGTDFTPASGTLTFAASETSQTVSVQTIEDRNNEANEIFTLTLSNATNATLDTNASATGTILDNDPPPMVSVSNASATEGRSVSFMVSLSADSGRQVTVDYVTSSGTATSGTDFTTASGTLTFAAGTTSQTVNVSTTEDDTNNEGDETFTLTLSNATNATLDTNASATGTIFDVEGPSEETPTPVPALPTAGIVLLGLLLVARGAWLVSNGLLHRRT